MIFQVLLAISEFKSVSGRYYHARVISLTKDIDKHVLQEWDYKTDNMVPVKPGIWKLTLNKMDNGKIRVTDSELVYNIGLG